MLELFDATTRRCDGVSRRSVLKAGLFGLSGLALPDLLRAEAKAKAIGPARIGTVVILVWLDAARRSMRPTTQARRSY